MKFEEAEKFIHNKLKCEIPHSLFYHSYGHTMDVLNAANQLAEMESIIGDDLLLLRIAVLLHDSGFTVQSSNHEEIGCEIARNILPQFDFTEKEIETICGMIMATKIPQTPHNHLEEIICDADLDYLGRDDFEPIADSLYKELEIYHIISDVNDWNRLQLKFLESHHYFSKSALSLRHEKKQKHMQKIKDIVNSIK